MYYIVIYAYCITKKKPNYNTDWLITESDKIMTCEDDTLCGGFMYSVEVH